MSDKPFTTSSDQLLPFADKGRFSREEIAIKRRKKASKHIPEKQCIFQTEVHFDPEFRNLPEMESVRQSIVSSPLTINTESISRYLSTMHERWRIQFQLQRLSGVMITPSIAVLSYKVSLNPAEGTSSFSLTKPACKVEDTIAQGQWFCQKQLWWDLGLILWKITSRSSELLSPSSKTRVPGSLCNHTVNQKTDFKTLYYSLLKQKYCILLLLSSPAKTKRNMHPLNVSHRNHTNRIFYKNIFRSINRSLRPSGRTHHTHPKLTLRVCVL